VEGLALTPEEGFVLSLLDAPHTAEEVVTLSSLPAERVEQILALFADKGIALTDVPSVRPGFETIPDVPPDDEAEEVTEKRALPPVSGAFDALSDFVSAVPPELRAVVASVSNPQPEPEPEPEPVKPDEPAITLAVKPMLDAQAVVLDEALPAATRDLARDWMREKFQTATSEERVTFLMESEGHTLPVLTGIPFDAKMTNLLCAKTFTSPLLVQNLCRFSACPASVLTHLLRQALVRRSPHLKRMVMSHSNLPNEVRKRG